ncbi:MAG TPA: hypothetical protein VK132_05630 [Gemmatimonadales bacterium]|nr:hypothetical protein [Gemmatimonadales bacterium]
MASDGVYYDDPSEAIAYLRDKVLGKKLGSSGMEIRPTSLPNGPQFLGLARIKAANRMDLNAIPRVAIGAAKHGAVPVWIIPTKGNPADAVPSALAQAQLNAPAGQSTAESYRLEFPKGMAPEELVSFAQQAIMSLGVQAGQGWQWIHRGGDQMPG